MTESFEFDVPATFAHIGPGFGVLALALDLPMHIAVAEGSAGGHVIERRGTAEEIKMDARHDAILRGMQVGADHFSIKLPGDLHIIADSQIPPATGLGTHTASFAAGVGIALRCASKQPEMLDILDLLIALGADPGHAGAALCGGLTAVCQTSTPHEELHFRVLPQPISESWRFVLACPKIRIPTADTRRILPPTLPHAVTARTASRLVGLLYALATPDPEVLDAFLFDEVHVPFRRRLVPGLDRAMAAGREAGADGVTISGHGPGLVALTTDESKRDAIAAAMVEAFAAAGQEVDTYQVEASGTGAQPAPS